MPETIKTLIVTLFLSQLIFIFQLKNKPTFIQTNELKQWQFLWLSVTTIAFISHNYWLFITLFIVIIKSKEQSTNSLKLTHYFLLLPVLPLLEKDIPGFAGIRFLFELSVPRLLSLFILLPIFLHISARSMPFLKMPGDKLFAFFLLINILVTTRNGEITNIIRSNFYLFLDIFLPYFTASRALLTFVDFQRISYISMLSTSILALIAIFEAIKGWHLYSSLHSALDISQRFSSYSFRGGLLRAHGPFSSGITLGYFLVIGLGFTLALKPHFKSQRFYIALLILITVALVATLSRGPWVGAVLLIIIYFLLSKDKNKQLKSGIIASIIVIPFLLFTSTGQKIVGMLPFIGNTESGSVTYRQQLLEQSWIVIQRHPFLGSNTYLNTPELQSLIQGQGIIDIVNSYVALALNLGLTGLISFIIFFAYLLNMLYQLRKKIPKQDKEKYHFANALIATMISILFIISTVSSIDTVSHYYWLLAGLISSYIFNLQRNNL